MQKPIPVEEALARVRERVGPGAVENVPLPALAGRVLARDLYSPLDLPPFPQSSMDGYAIRAEAGRETWALAGETRAGEPPAGPLPQGAAWRVFTGAPVPEGADTVVRQEVAEVEEGVLRFRGEEHRQAGKFVRPKGGAVAAGERILEAGTVLRPGALGFLAACGLDRAPVYRRPAVRILGSGDELVPPGLPLGPGQIHESNTFALEAAARAEGLTDVAAACLPDDPERLGAAVREALTGELGPDGMLVLSGGISVGDHDHVGRALAEAGVERIFHGVAQKPGKPLFFGTRGQQLVFALPGNPASSLVTFWIYARLALRLRMGYGLSGTEALEERTLPLAEPRENRSPRASFERARVADGRVHPLDGQDSYQLRSLARANALLCLPPGPVAFAGGDPARVLLLPG